ncbi:uncharacterized protein BO72DRAFT_224917 [Aspergillus fijiensis CBS 313.89]|uniref:Uncharacterized protein n=1 Tax=Aspergillus fijiensis CBS 313.89 TaxID=1448319 RepID=A0A8G1VV68_9EURO|nr:uncharacterized protein BO72DRAFT_224917 [Aspergillus fijiensis CBS 313.89]RAK73817.1 hypothetical protein BO72DRAFT_224917 [Aspergillus fijiensis CBS 313.89]
MKLKCNFKNRDRLGPFSPVFNRGNFPYMTASLDQPSAHKEQIGERASLPHTIVCPLSFTSVIPMPVNPTCDFCGQSIADAKWIHCLVCLDICLHMHCHQPATEMKGHVFTARSPILTSQTTGPLPEPGFNPSCMTGHLISSKRQMYCFLVKDIPRAKYRVMLMITIRFLLPGRVSSYDATIRACMGDPKNIQDFGGSSLRSYGPDIPVENLFRVAFPLKKKHQVRLDGKQNLDHYSFDRGSEGNEFLVSNSYGDMAVAIELSGFSEAHMQDGPSQPAFDLTIDGLNLLPVAEDREAQRTSITKNLSGMVRKILG